MAEEVRLSRFERCRKLCSFKLLTADSAKAFQESRYCDAVTVKSGSYGFLLIDYYIIQLIREPCGIIFFLETILTSFEFKYREPGMSIMLEGNWKRGLAFDVHTLSSTYLGVNEFGYDQWESTRSEIGELLYQLKYHADAQKVREIVRLLDKIKGIETMDYLIPVPSTNQHRRIQPVVEIVRVLGEERGVAVLEGVLCKRAGGVELKNVTELDEREAVLQDKLYLDNFKQLEGKNVMLIDDLYRSGATLRVATELLYRQACVKDVFVLTMTKTRSKR